MKVTLWGTRGSSPSAGPENIRYGGNTACVEVRAGDGTLVILDAGTGIRRLGAAISEDIKRVDVLLTHLHLDHIQGLGFFAPLYRDGLEVHIWGPPTAGLTLEGRLTRYLSPPLFPVRLRELPCDLTLHDLPMEPFQIGGLSIRGDFVCHPGPTLGYRIAENGTSLAYLPDHEPALGFGEVPRDADWISGFEIAAQADLLIHDSQYSDEEYPAHIGWGHSAISHTIAFATAAKAKRLVVFHHDPAHNDATLDRLVDTARKVCKPPFEILAGTEGAMFKLG
ncbi:MAG: MBL fold metallo-hydrolase [Dehalococcoidia bacterium]